MGDPLVGDERHLETAPGRDPVQCGDDRFLGQQDLLVDVADRTEPMLDLMYLHGARLAQVDAGAEGAVARSRQHDAGNVVATVEFA